MPLDSPIILSLKKWLILLLLVACLGEMIFFPSAENFIGCIMVMVALVVYLRFFLKRRIILQYPFAFFMYSSMFLYRYLPLVATLIEGKPITFGIQMGAETFMYEILLFLLSSLAFGLACPNRDLTKNNAIQSTLAKFYFFKSNSIIIWAMGIVGLVVRLYTFSTGGAEYGEVSGKFIEPIKFFMYAPLVLMFPSLSRAKSQRLYIWIYCVGLSVLNIASNSREQLITPFGILGLLFFIDIVKNDIRIKELISPKLIVAGVLFVVFGVNMLSNFSMAMIYTRALRADVSRTELFAATIQTYQNKELMQKLQAAANQMDAGVTDYSKGWDETYIDNFMLNRYANMRISDQSLYYAKQMGFGHPKMSTYFWDKTWALLPTPLLRFFHIDIIKSDLEYSPGDLMYGKLGGFRVCSHVGFGLAAFDYWYFPFQFILFFFVFKLLNTFIYLTNQSDLVYSPYGLLHVFIFLGMFRNSIGALVDIGFIFRGYIQGVGMYLLLLLFVRFFLVLCKPQSCKVLSI